MLSSDVNRRGSHWAGISVSYAITTYVSLQLTNRGKICHASVWLRVHGRKLIFNPIVSCISLSGAESRGVARQFYAKT